MSLLLTGGPGTVRGFLDPEPGPARDLLRRELSGAEYRPSLLDQARDFVFDLIGRATEAVAETGALNLVTLLVLAVALVVAALWLVARLRPETRARGGAPVLGETMRTAAEHRRRAREALDGSRWDEAVTEAVRGLARDLEQRPATGTGEVRAGSTAREVVAVAAGLFGSRRTELERAARSFEDVVYGQTAASADEAERTVVLVEELAGATPEAAGGSPVAVAPQ